MGVIIFMNTLLAKTFQHEIDLLDLRDFTRNSSQMDCKIFVETQDEDTVVPVDKLWIQAGEVSFSEDREGVTTIFAHTDQGATDPFHDSTQAFSFEVVGLRFQSLFYGMSMFIAYIRPHPGLDLQFRVPKAGANPFVGATTCTECEKPHPLIEMFRPEPNADLYEKLRGVRIKIIVGPGSR